MPCNMLRTVLEIEKLNNGDVIIHASDYNPPSDARTRSVLMENCKVFRIIYVNGKWIGYFRDCVFDFDLNLIYEKERLIQVLNEEVRHCGASQII